MFKPPLDLIKRALEEDGAAADITTLSTVPEDQWAEGVIVARPAGVIAGLSVAAETFRARDERVAINLLGQDGASVRAGEALAESNCPAGSILSAERAARK